MEESLQNFLYFLNCVWRKLLFSPPTENIMLMPLNVIVDTKVSILAMNHSKIL